MNGFDKYEGKIFLDKMLENRRLYTTESDIDYDTDMDMSDNEREEFEPTERDFYKYDIDILKEIIHKFDAGWKFATLKQHYKKLKNKQEISSIRSMVTKKGLIL